MWGSKFGWSVSAGIVLVYLGAMCIIVFPGGVAAPTSLSNSTNLGAVTVNPSPNSLLDLSNPADAAPLYRQAINAYDYVTFDRYLHDSRAKGADGAALAPMKPLLEATHCVKGSIFANDPSEIVNYDNDKKSLVALEAIGNAATQTGLRFETEQNPQEAQNYYLAVFSLGAKMYAERLTLQEFLDGSSMMSGASTQMENLDTAHASDWKALRENLASNSRKMLEISKELLSASSDKMTEHAGDALLFADKASERMWRVQAVLALGRMKYADGNKGDKFAAKQEIHKLMTDPDTAVQAAAKAADELTHEKFRTINGAY